ncbi:MAG: sugar transferase [Syntrophorhabdaceae bacterium]
MKRLFDIAIAAFLLGIFSIPMMIIAFAVKLTSKGPVIYWSDRVGFDNVIFKMPKFRTMQKNAPHVATHLLDNADSYLTSIGPCLRKYSLDELPQVFSILKGDMSLVGPRPALYNQQDLIELRTARGVHRLIPGMTGWAQINGRDEISIPVKVTYDEYYLNNRCFSFDLKILWMTLLKVIRSEGIRH